MKTYMIKPLEWEYKKLYKRNEWGASTLIGWYKIDEEDTTKWEFDSEMLQRVKGEAKNFSEAKKAAEAHYIQQMERGLETIS